MAYNKLGVISRTISTLIISLPLAYNLNSVINSDLEKYNSYTHEQLLIYLKGKLVFGFTRNLIITFLLACFLYLLAEFIAYSIRFAFRITTRMNKSNQSLKRTE
jgi:hypothetical protein